MAVTFLPVLSHFQNLNPWLAGDGRLRFRIVPTLPEGEEGSLTVQVWEGPWAYEFASVEETQVFPLTQEGLEAVQGWLDQWSAAVNARPERTLAENISRKVKPAAPETPAS